MSIDRILQTLSPEWILLAGGCVVLIIGVAPKSLAGGAVAPVALLTVLAALAASLAFLVGDPVSPIPGLWLTSLTLYARLVTLGVGALIVLVNWDQPAAVERGEYYSMILFSLLGVLLTASASDMIVLFFAVELVSIPTYVLIALSRTDGRASESAVKYFFLGALSAAILAYGLSLLYGSAGTTALFAAGASGPVSNLGGAITGGSLGLIGLLLVVAGLGFKIAAVPFHVYAADVYEGAASPVSGLLGFVPKAAGFLALCKVFAAVEWRFSFELFWLLWILAGATMTAGNVLALLQRNVKRILAYSSIAHTGYMLVALLVGPAAGSGPLRDGVAALLFYVALYGAMNLGAFAFLSLFQSDGREAETLDDVSGVAVRSPGAAFGLAVCLFGLIGMPPTAGLFGKWYIFGSALSVGESNPHSQALIVLVVIGVVNAAIGAAYYLRILASVYMGTEEAPASSRPSTPARLGLALCSLAVCFFFIRPAALTRPAAEASYSLKRTMHGGGVKVTGTDPRETQVPLALPRADEDHVPASQP